MNDFEVRDDFEEILIPPAILRLTKGTLGIVDLGGIVEDPRDKYDGDRVIGSGLPPSRKKFR